MVDNQHKLIAGYRDLTQAEIELINVWKEIEQLLDRYLTRLDPRGTAQGRWNAMARTHLETGIMYAIKAVAAPHGGLGNPDDRPASHEAAITRSRQFEMPPESDRDDDEAFDDPQAKAQERKARQAAADAEAHAKDRERRVHEDRQRHGFDPYAAKAQKARPAEVDEAEAENAEELRSIENEEIRRELDAEEADEELRSIEDEEIRRELDAEDEGVRP
jgi:hypothetical protein